MNKNSKIYVAGHNGMVGSALVRKLTKEGFNNLIVRSSSQLDLRNQNQVNDFFSKEMPEYVFLAAARVGGIVANNSYKADFIYDNLLIEANVIHAAYLNKVQKLLFLGSSCIYPKMAPQPLKEEYLLSGYLESTNQPYAIAKIAGIEMCDAYRSQYGCNFISAMPSNLYGPNDNYDLERSHVLPALLRKCIIAKANNEPEMVIWGSGTPLREFLYVEDLADACIFLMENFDESGFINIGSGTEISILELANLIKKIVGYEGLIKLDKTKPDGTPRKVMDISKIIQLGWIPKTKLEDGIFLIYQSIKNNHWE